MRQTGNGQRRKIAKIAKANKSKKPKSQNDTKTKFKNKGAHKIGATQASPHRTALRYCGSERSRQSDLQWPQNTAAAPNAHIHTQATTRARSKKNNKILFSRLLTLTLTASKSYEPYSLSLPAVPRQKLSLTAWPHKMPSYIQSLPRVPKKITREKQQQYKQAQVEILQLPFARQISSQEDSWQVHFNGITRESPQETERGKETERRRETERE